MTNRWLITLAPYATPQAIHWVLLVAALGLLIVGLAIPGAAANACEVGGSGCGG